LYELVNNAAEIAIGDLNEDQIPDLAIADEDGAGVLLGLGDGSFAEPIYHAAGDSPWSIGIGDLNGDQLPDLVVTNNDAIAVLLSLGGGEFAQAVFVEAHIGLASATSLALGNLDGDEALDLAIVSGEFASVAVLLGHGNGTFSEASYYEAGARTCVLAIGDLNSDLFPDIAVGNNWHPSCAAILLGLGDGTFAEPSFYSPGGGAVAIGDLNGDQTLDLVAGPAVLLGASSPSPVELAWFEVVAGRNVVMVRWETSFESDHLGFHVYRTSSGRDDFERTNDGMIRGVGSHEFIDHTVVPGQTYAYRLEAVDVSGGTQVFDLGSVTVGNAPPQRLVLHQASPNPLKPSARLAFDLPHAGYATLRIYDAGGRLVRILVDGMLEANAHSVVWDGRDDRGQRLGSGVYFYRLHAGDRTLSRKLVLVE
jgi:hypothetical protein